MTLVASNPSGEPLANSTAYLDGERIYLPAGFAEVKVRPGPHNLTIYWHGVEVYRGQVTFDVPRIYRVTCKVYTLNVYVKDWAGRPISGVEVSLKGKGLSRVATSGLGGLAVFKDVPGGEYLLSCGPVELLLRLRGDESLSLHLPPPLPLLALPLILAALVAFAFYLIVKRSAL